MDQTMEFYILFARGLHHFSSSEIDKFKELNVVFLLILKNIKMRMETEPCTFYKDKDSKI